MDSSNDKSDSNTIDSNDNIETEIIGMSIDNQELRFQPEDALKYVLGGKVILLSDGSKFDINGDGKIETIGIDDSKPVDSDELGSDFDGGAYSFHYWLCLQDFESSVNGWVYCENPIV